MILKRRFKVDKLVRDKLPIIMGENNIAIGERIMGPIEYLQRLKDKLLEEAKEVLEANTRTEVQEELADILEVIHALAQVYGLSYEQIEAKRIEKKAEKGGFDTRLYSAFLEYDLNHPWMSYCLKHPDKYPEIKMNHVT